MKQKHATRNELAQAFIDIWLQLNFRICDNTLLGDNPVVANTCATRAELQREILDIKLQISGLLDKYKNLMQDEVELNNRRCARQ